jgi:hypothetical protein
MAPGGKTHETCANDYDASLSARGVQAVRAALVAAAGYFTS